MHAPTLQPQAAQPLKVFAQRPQDRANALIATAQRIGAMRAIESGGTDMERALTAVQSEAESLRGYVHSLVFEAQELRSRIASPLEAMAPARFGRYWTVRQTGGAGYEVVPADNERYGTRIAYSYNRYHAELLAMGPHALDLLRQFIDATPDKRIPLVREAEHCMYGPLSAKADIESHASAIRAAAPENQKREAA